MKHPYKIKALKDNPIGGCIKKGEIGIWSHGCYYNFPSQKGYSVSEVSPHKFKIIQQNEYDEINNEPQYEIY